LYFLITASTLNLSTKTHFSHNKIYY
jgi:hypothetical protein